MQCVRVVVYSIDFFHKTKFIFENCLLKSQKDVFPGNYDINYYYCYHYIVIVHLFTVDKKTFHIILKKS